MTHVFVWGAVVSLLASSAVVNADELGPAIDLTRFGTSATDEAAVAATGDDFDCHEVGLLDDLRRANRTFYISGMIGPSFSQLNVPSRPALGTSDDIFIAGGAVGIAFDRRRGHLRLELEGMGRADYAAPPFAEFPNILSLAHNGWSVMQNVWRDVMLTERFGVYGGGGLGAGGYTDGEVFGGVTEFAPPASAFAWQFGGGLIYEISDRLTFDVGYRYFHIDEVSPSPAWVTSQFAASELLFSLRLYEPFQRWRR